MSGGGLPNLLPKPPPPDPPLPTPPPSRFDSKQRKNITSACYACRAARTKCDASKPCGRCVSLKVECVSDETQDGRKSRKHRLDEVANKAQALDVILDFLRTSDDDSLRELRQLARNERPVNEIVDQARLALGRRELRSKTRARLRQAITSIASLVDDPAVRVPARPWTRVLDDDEAVSHLMSVYFTWQHHGYPSVDQSLFVKEMNSQDLSSQFCSPFLVNSMLLAACMYTDHPSAFADPDNRSTRGAHFLEEAVRLWNLEGAAATLVNLQAFPSLISGHVVTGKDRVGALYTTQSLALAVELTKSVKKGIKQGRTEFETPDFQRSYSLALWAVFCIQTEVAIAWMKPFDLRPPKVRPDFDELELRRQEVWYPYPNPGPKVAYCPLAIDDERLRLFAIAAECLPVVLSGNPQDSPLPGHVILDGPEKSGLLVQVELKLLSWYAGLHQDLHIDSSGKERATGPLVDLHLTYHGFQATVQSLVLHARDKEDPEREAAEDNLINACQSIAALLRQQRLTMTFQYFSIYHVHASSLAAFNLLDFLERPGIPDSFHVVVSALSAASPRWMLARGIVKVVWITLKERKLETHLDESTMSLLKLSAVDNWGPKDHELFEMCTYPNYAAVEEKGRDLVEIGDLIQQYARTHLEG